VIVKDILKLELKDLVLMEGNETLKEDSNMVLWFLKNKVCCDEIC
jgi:hypothetical protein